MSFEYLLGTKYHSNTFILFFNNSMSCYYYLHFTVWKLTSEAKWLAPSHTGKKLGIQGFTLSLMPEPNPPLMLFLLEKTFGMFIL